MYFHSHHVELFYQKAKVFQVKYDLLLWVRPHTIQTLQSPYQKEMLQAAKTYQYKGVINPCYFEWIWMPRKV